MKRMIPIWFFVGGLLSIYGVLILAAGIRSYVEGTDVTIVMHRLHLQLWWGVALVILGFFYVIRYWPRRGNNK
jgi:hypothetical protein